MRLKILTTVRQIYIYDLKNNLPNNRSDYCLQQISGHQCYQEVMTVAFCPRPLKTISLIIFHDKNHSRKDSKFNNEGERTHR